MLRVTTLVCPQMADTLKAFNGGNRCILLIPIFDAGLQDQFCLPFLSARTHRRFSERKPKAYFFFSSSFAIFFLCLFTDTFITYSPIEIKCFCKFCCVYFSNMVRLPHFGRTDLYTEYNKSPFFPSTADGSPAQ